MGFLEAVIVIYLRKLFYPNGFSFPLIGFIEPSILNIEWIREFATIVMLAAVGYLAAKKFYVRFAYFLYAFAVWDIFYYVFLKLTINWPSSLLTWDLLFLIPWPWIGPVIAPVICSLLFIVFALLIIHFEDKVKPVKISGIEWTAFIIASILTLYSWLYDYGALIFKNGFGSSFLTLENNSQFIALVSSYSPSSYNWTLFSIAVVIAIFGIISFYRRNKD